MATAKKETKVVEPERVIPAKVEETITLTLTRAEADEIYSLVAKTNAKNKTYGVYCALGDALHGKDVVATPKHRVSFSDNLIQLQAR